MNTIEDDNNDEEIKYKYVCYKCNNYKTNTKQNLMKHMTQKKNPCNAQKQIVNIFQEEIQKYIIRYDSFMLQAKNSKVDLATKIKDWRVLYIQGSRIKNMLNDNTNQELYKDFINYHNKISTFDF